MANWRDLVDKIEDLTIAHSKEMELELGKQKQELKEKIKSKVYGYDENEESGCVDWKDILKIFE